MEPLQRFENRSHAGQLLAKRLLAYAGRPDVLVLALARGGVPVAYSIAHALRLALDVLLVRKIGFPGHAEYAMGAIASGGICILQAQALSAFDIAPELIEASAQRELHEIERREKIYRAQSPALPWRERVVILVDDGLATGSTMQVAAHVVREANPARLLVAVPVGSPQACDIIRPMVDELICLSIPEPFHAVGLWYEHFDQVSDERVRALLDKQRAQLAASS